jgi:hypothetical protein
LSQTAFFIGYDFFAPRWQWFRTLVQFDSINFAFYH